MNRLMKWRWVGCSLVTVAVLGIGSRAEAQDARVRVVVPTEIIDEVMRTVNRIVVTDVGPQIDAAMRTALGTGDFRIRDFMALRDIRRDAQNRDFRVTQEARETRTLKLGTAGALEIRNVGGNITVSAASGSDATVEIVRTARARTDADAKLGLEKVTVELDQRGDRATLSVNYPDTNRPPYSVSTAFEVKAPAGTRITINTLGGDISVSDIKGDVSTSTHGGNTTITNGRNVDVKSLGGTIALTNIESDGTVQAETYGGDLDLKQIKARRLQGSTLGGNVSATDITCDSADLGTMGGNVSFGGTLAKNGRYELHTAGGDVRFMPLGAAGYELQASTFSGEIRTEGVTLQMTGTVSNRGINRSLRGVVGDGSALVILRTLSGTVIVGRK